MLLIQRVLLAKNLNKKIAILVIEGHLALVVSVHEYSNVLHAELLVPVIIEIDQLEHALEQVVEHGSIAQVPRRLVRDQNAC